MATKTLSENITQAIDDFDAIKTAIVAKGVDIPAGTPTSQYGTKIGDISGGGGVTPEKGFVPTAWDANGYITEGDFYGEEVAESYFYMSSSNPLGFKGIKDINFTNDIKTIKTNAFRTCTELGLTYLPESLTNLESSAFYGCTKLDLISIPNSITTISNSLFRSCESLSLSQLHDGITSIETYAFMYCYKLALTELPPNITQIQDRSFFGCSSLKITTIPESVTKIGAANARCHCFYGCTGIETMEIPLTTQYIYDNAFANCTGLTTVTFKKVGSSSAINTLNSTAFSGCTNLLTINVPWNSGQVSGAPFGASNATIVYNYTP